MQKIYRSSFAIDKGEYNAEKVGTLNEFLNLSVEDILIQHHKKNADTTHFFLSADKKQDQILFLLTQDKNLISHLKMSKPNPQKTNDLLEPIEQTNFTSIKLNKLVEAMEEKQADYALDIDGRGYSFRLVLGIKATNLLDNIDSYKEHLDERPLNSLQFKH